MPREKGVFSANGVGITIRYSYVRKRSWTPTSHHNQKPTQNRFRYVKLKTIKLQKLVLNWARFWHPPLPSTMIHLAMFGDIFDAYQHGAVLLTSSGKRPRMLLNILQYTGQSCKIKNYLVQISKAPRLRNPVLEKK